ncbi:MAG TPA: hypothetical protein VF811_11135 [Parasulfuritortus sp.]
MDTHIALDGTVENDRRTLLESRFPHIMEGVLKAWNDPETTNVFLNSILVDDRDNRKGLPEEVFAELMFLSDLNWKRTHFNSEGVQVSPDSFSFRSI